MRNPCSVRSRPRATSLVRQGTHARAVEHTPQGGGTVGLVQAGKPSGQELGEQVRKAVEVEQVIWAGAVAALQQVRRVGAVVVPAAVALGPGVAVVDGRLVVGQGVLQGADLLRAELQAVVAVLLPGAGRLQEFAGGGRGQVADDRDQVPVRLLLAEARDEIGAANFENLPWMFTATLITMIAANALFSFTVARMSRRRFIPLAYRFFILNLVIFFVLMRALPGAREKWIGPCFFLWVSVFNLFATSIFWAFMNDLFTTEQGKRLFGFIAVGGSCFATEWGYAIAFLFFMVVIFIRPQGLLGGKA